ncbi:HIT domain-containing protein [Candidatus Gracilibacteria bacterium]|nr:HIT domain-containing protein [Candidatus Gracilibacteria bacterium]NUJ99438.1 HIT domain-containing protein [Candidatus Gracilibacteria bacterium]
MKSIFTRIIEREIPSDIVYEQDNIIVIKDIAPKAKTHLLIIPKKEIPSINEIQKEDSDLIAELFFVAKKMAYDLNIQQGYQLKFHVGALGGQEVMHLHLHLLSNI